MARYVLAGPQPCELVDVKVDLTYKYNTVTRSGSFFRATQSLKLVRILQWSFSSWFAYLLLFLKYLLIQNFPFVSDTKVTQNLIEFEMF